MTPTDRVDSLLRRTGGHPSAGDLRQMVEEAERKRPRASTWDRLWLVGTWSMMAAIWLSGTGSPVEVGFGALCIAAALANAVALGWRALARERGAPAAGRRAWRRPGANVGPAPKGGGS